ncbi:hypothetical protein D3C86_1034080 [compost metagenome]
MAHAGNVEAAGREVRGHQDLEIPLPEPLHHLLTMRLGHFPVDPVRRDPFAAQPARDMLGFFALGDEDDGLLGRLVGQHLDQLRDLVARMGLHPEVLDTDGRRSLVDGDPLGIPHPAADQALDGCRHGG